MSCNVATQFLPQIKKKHSLGYATSTSLYIKIGIHKKTHKTLYVNMSYQYKQLGQPNILDAFYFSEQSEEYANEGDFLGTFHQSQQASNAYQFAKNDTCDARALNALTFLQQHYMNRASYFEQIMSNQAQFQRSNETNHVSQSNTFSKDYPVLNINGSEVSYDSIQSRMIFDESRKQSFYQRQKRSNMGIAKGLSIDSTFINNDEVDNTFVHRSTEADAYMYNQFHELFIEPWKQYWSNHLQYETDSTQLIQTFFQNMSHVERNLSILMQIANLNNSSSTTLIPSPTTPNVSISGVNGHIPQEEVAQRLKSLYTNLNSIQVARLNKQISKLEKQVLELQKSLEQERNLRQQEEHKNELLEKELEKTKDILDKIKQKALQKQQKQGDKPSANKI